jgi:acyl dehydratase
MANSTFSVLANERYFEDYIPDSVYEFGSIVVEEKEIIEFAKRYDPQVFHTNPVAARNTIFGGLIASGWHTAALAMRLLVDNFIPHVACMGSPGIDEIRWLKAVRPGDEISIRVQVLEAKRSKSKPDRGTVRAFMEVLNQNREIVMSQSALIVMLCRDKT